MKQDLSQSITEMPTFLTHKISRQNQQILYALMGFLVSGAVPDKFISAPRITALGKKLLTSNNHTTKTQHSPTYAEKPGGMCWWKKVSSLGEGGRRWGRDPDPTMLLRSAINLWLNSDQTQTFAVN